MFNRIKPNLTLLDRRLTTWKIEMAARKTARLLSRSHAKVTPADVSPEDIAELSRCGDALFFRGENGSSPDPVAESRRILEIIGRSFATPTLTDAYFHNLFSWLQTKGRREKPGTLIIGLGTGRCGSTSLAARLAAVADSCSTHENPPLVFWRPVPQQISFHFRRFALLLDRHALVADCAHWWINVVDELVAEFPDVKFVGLIRNKFDCVSSFARLKGIGRATDNHWAPHPNKIWQSNLWDPTYPTFEIPAYADRDPDAAKWAALEQYWTLYNSRLSEAAARRPDQFLLLNTEQLDDPESLDALFSFVGAAPDQQFERLKLNVRSTRDGSRSALRV